MDTQDIEESIRKRVALSGRVVLATVIAGILMFAMILAVFFMETVDMELAAAGNQLRLFVLSNAENFETSEDKAINDKALKKAAWNLARSPLVSHVAVFDPRGQIIVWIMSPAYGAASDTEYPDVVQLQTIQNKAKLMMATSGSDLVAMELPSGRVVYRAYTPVTAKKGTVRLGEVEMGFFKSEITSKSLNNLRTPGAVAIACILLLILLASGVVRRWEASKARELSQFFETQLEKVKTQFDRKVEEQKKDRESKDVDGGSFFNILESVRDLSGAPDIDTFVRRLVLSSVRLFRCRMVSFYLNRSDNGKPADWELSGRYDGKGYAHEVKESLDLAAHPRLKEALGVGATELLQGYPTEATAALLIAVVTEKPIGAILLHNKIGTFDSKDLMAARIFAGFLPNLLAWHVK